MISPKQAAARKWTAEPEQKPSADSTWQVLHDELGEVRMPAHHPFGAHTWRATRTLAISNRRTPFPLIEALLSVKSACAHANQESGALNEQIAKRIQSSIEKILEEKITHPEKWAERFPLDYWQSGAGTNLNMNINETVAYEANGGRIEGPIRAHDHVNKSQSSNSVFPTAMRVAILAQCKMLLHELHLTAQCLLKRSIEFKDLEKPARTHLQDALPTTLGKEWKAWSQALERCRHWIGESRTELLKISLGAGAAGTGLAVPWNFGHLACQKLRELTREPHFEDCPDFSADFLQSPFAPTHYHSQLALLACELHRIGSDLRLLASGPRCGLGEIQLQPVHAGSSMMPGKINPSILELISQIAFQVQGNQTAAYLAYQNGQLDLNVMTPILANLTLDSTDLLTHALRLVRTEVLETLEPKPGRLREYSRVNTQKATALLPHYGHKKVGEWIQEALKANVPIEEVLPPAVIEEMENLLKNRVRVP